jgi:hypothetical protein
MRPIVLLDTPILQLREIGRLFLQNFMTSNNLLRINIGNSRPMLQLLRIQQHYIRRHRIPLPQIHHIPNPQLPPHHRLNIIAADLRVLAVGLVVLLDELAVHVDLLADVQDERDDEGKQIKGGGVGGDFGEGAGEEHADQQVQVAEPGAERE